jgi:hypothetical protein
MFLCPDVLCSVDLLSDSMPSGRVCDASGRELFAFFAKHIHYFLSVLSCCVVLFYRVVLFYHVVLCVFSFRLIPRF